ncbi:MAG TPA: Zn-ribbon domain-containing OB-fold protein [bacterium]|jgi:hypothetical protein|nr:Zn-ribbon domain-containing OB-fold protein [bacterium]
MGLRDRITETARLRAWEGEIGVSFRYTAGAAGERFFQTLRARGVFAVTRCPECGSTYLPPRLYCPKDFQDLDQHWEEVAPRGTIHTFTLLHHDLDGRALTRPYLIGVVQIEGTEGGLLAPLALDPSTVRIGQRVSAVLRPKRKRRGVIEDILHFR